MVRCENPGSSLFHTFLVSLLRDEPTSGLDARSALLIVRLLRRIANQKRTIVATIHQPSSAVFELFDDLLLLKKGGEMTYHGPLGDDSRNVIDYFECEGAVPIELGDNPANWILRVMQDEDLGDLAQIYKASEPFNAISQEIDDLTRDANPEHRIQYDSKFATSYLYRQHHVNKRLSTIVSVDLRLERLLRQCLSVTHHVVFPSLHRFQVLAIAHIQFRSTDCVFGTCLLFGNGLWQGPKKSHLFRARY